MNDDCRRFPRMPYFEAICGISALSVAVAMAYSSANDLPSSEQSAPISVQSRLFQNRSERLAQAVPDSPRRDTIAKGREERREVRQAKRAARGLGMKVESKGDQGLVVTNIEENSLAAQAGLRPNDRIIFVDGRPFTHGRQLDAYLAGHGGRRVPVIIDRSGQRLTVYMTPAQLASDTAWLGVYLEEGESNATGARITQVYPSGPAARAGLQPGDTITQIDDRRIEHPADLISRVQELEPQTQSQLVIVRANRELKVPVTLGSRETFVHSQQASYGNENSQPPVENEQAQNANGPSEFDDVPEHAMGLEQDRRNAEQHQRIEHEIQLLREEIRQLREELKKK